jgi:hypothetical protein
MAMSEGTVTIDGSGNATGDGCAKEIFDELDAGQDYGPLTGTELQTAKEQVAVVARAIAKVIPHIVNNGKAKISTSDAGLQLLPASLTEDEPCKAPTSDKLLDLV